MWAILSQAGWTAFVILGFSVITVMIIIERSLSLRKGIVASPDLTDLVVKEVKADNMNAKRLAELQEHSPLGRILATGLKHQKSPRDVMKEAIEETGRSVAHELERFLTTLGTIATVAPLMGLLGTVLGMIHMFASQAPGTGSPEALAQGISEALYNTALGLVVAIPAMIAYRHFRAKVDSLLVDMEQEAIKLVEQLHGDR
jgi:biopolymer transport protein ExbB